MAVRVSGNQFEQRDNKHGVTGQRNIEPVHEPGPEGGKIGPGDEPVSVSAR